MNRRSSLRLGGVAVLAAATVVVGVNAVVGGSAIAREEAPVACRDLPHLWTGAVEISYYPETHLVGLVWDDGEHAQVADSDPGCEAQPMLEAMLRDKRDGAVAADRAACSELGELVSAVRSERQGRGQSVHGRVPVSDAAQAAVARSHGISPAAAVAKRHAAGSAIDLDQADAVLAQCPH